MDGARYGQPQRWQSEEARHSALRADIIELVGSIVLGGSGGLLRTGTNLR